VSTTNDPTNGFGAAMDRDSMTDRAEDRIAEETERARETFERASARSRELEDELRRGASDAAARLKESEERLEASLEDGMERLKDYVRRNPIASAGVAFVAGLVISSLIRR
jgi:ElaB/YqjD/DUF883 family membrane-anchored ribosome-binding protein